MARPSDDEPLTDAQRRLVDDHVRLAAYLVRDVRRKHPDLSEDILSDTYLELCRAAKRYDPAKFNTTFAGYLGPTLSQRARRSLAFHFRRQGRFRPTANLDDAAYVDTTRDAVDARLDVPTLLSLLDDTSRNIITRRYLEGLPVKDAYADVGSAGQGYRIEIKARDRMRTLIE